MTRIQEADPKTFRAVERGCFVFATMSSSNVVGAITGKGGRYITPTHPEGHDYD